MTEYVTIDLDERDFELTAKAVFMMNPSVRSHYNYWEDLLEFMKDMASHYLTNKDCLSFSTYGFNLNGYFRKDGTKVIRAAVAGHMAHNYLLRTNVISEYKDEV
ncbi:MAG: hypothetical protein RLZZ196_1758 [Bacteroidota bacterium]|jgi:hypothetical protein